MFGVYAVTALCSPWRATLSFMNSVQHSHTRWLTISDHDSSLAYSLHWTSINRVPQSPNTASLCRRCFWVNAVFLILFFWSPSHLLGPILLYPVWSFHNFFYLVFFLPIWILFSSLTAHSSFLTQKCTKLQPDPTMKSCKYLTLLLDKFLSKYDHAFYLTFN